MTSVNQVLENNLNIRKHYCKNIFWAGGAASILLFFYSLSTIIIVSLIGGPPETIEECFSMLNENKLYGLLRLDILTVFVMPLYYLLFYSIYIVIRKVNHELTAVSTILAFVGVTLFLAAPSVFSYLNLSNQYAAAVTEIEKSQLLAAGKALMAADIWHGTGSQIGGILVQTGATIISFLMLKDRIFSKLTAYTGILMHGLDLVHILVGFFSPSAGAVIMFAAGPLYLVWFPLVGMGLFKQSILPNGAIL